MKLDRNLGIGRGKYALIKLRELTAMGSDGSGMVTLNTSCIDYGNTADTDFFVIRLKDKYAAPALKAYALAAMDDDPEYGNEVMHLAGLSASHPNKKRPD